MAKDTHREWVIEQQKSRSNAEILASFEELQPDILMKRGSIRPKLTAKPDVMLVGNPPLGLIEVEINAEGKLVSANILERKRLALENVTKWLGGYSNLVDSTRVLTINNLDGKPQVELRVRRNSTKAKDLVEEEGPIPTKKSTKAVL